MGFRYGPQIRFFRSTVNKKLDEAEKEMINVMPDLVREILMNDEKKTKVSK